MARLLRPAAEPLATREREEPLGAAPEVRRAQEARQLVLAESAWVALQAVQVESIREGRRPSHPAAAVVLVAAQEAPAAAQTVARWEPEAHPSVLAHLEALL